jgi:hypothetical protein
MKKYIYLILVLFLSVVFVPVLITQLSPSESRGYSGVHLNELDYQEISFQNTRPEPWRHVVRARGRRPLSGCGGHTRFGHQSPRQHLVLTLTAHLQKNGVAVLLPDKRGSEKSEGDWHTSSFEDLATDTLAAIDFLKNQNMVDVSRIGIVGMSQGGWIAPIVVSESPDVEFVISVVGSSVTTYEQVA